MRPPFKYIILNLIEKVNTFFRGSKELTTADTGSVVFCHFRADKTNEEIKAKTIGITDPAELVSLANEAGYDVTLDALIEADRELRASVADKTELSENELEKVAGGACRDSEDAPDGHEPGCAISYHDYSYQKNNNIWCKKDQQTRPRETGGAGPDLWFDRPFCAVRSECTAAGL